MVSLAAAIVAVTLACKGQFDGPYACTTGFASCTTATGCETETFAEGSNCGSCGHRCEPGAACTNGTCGAAPAVFKKTATPAYLTLSPTSLLAWVAGAPSGSGGTLIVAPRSGGTPVPVPLPSLETCGSAPFAIDSSNVYVVAQYNNGSGMEVTSLLAQALPPPGGADAGPVDAGLDACGTLDECCATELHDAAAKQCSDVVSLGHVGECDVALGKFEATGQCSGAHSALVPLGQGITCAASLSVSGGTVYYSIASQTSMGNGAGSATFYSVPTTGGKTPSSLGTAEGWSGGATAVSQGSIYFGPICNNGPCGVVGALPTSGGSPTYTPQLGAGYGGQGALTADSTGVYVATSGWECGNDGGVPAVLSGGTTVASIPPGGGRATVLATTHDGSPVTSIAVDAANVYWISGGNAWTAPKGGGTATPIAGNLGAPDAGAAVPCSSVSGGASSTTPSLVSDGTYVYIADPSSNAIYKVPAP